VADGYEYQKWTSPPFQDGSATPEKIQMGACNQGEKFLDFNYVSSQALRLL